MWHRPRDPRRARACRGRTHAVRRLLVAGSTLGLAAGCAGLPSADPAGPTTDDELAPLSARCTHPWLRQVRIRSDDEAFERAEVWAYGDSITVWTARSLAEQIGPRIGTTLAVDAQSSIPTTPATERLLARLRSTANRPRVLLFALGTNDAAVTYPSLEPANSEPMQVWRDLAAVRAVTGPATALVFVEVYRHHTRAASARMRAVELAHSRTINEQVRASRIPDAIVPWYAAMAAGESTYLVDGVHPSEAGTAYRTAVIMPVLEQQYAAHPD
ncbi:SGNH/GDSL hydrolase family protein [Arsenicicoccus dermatophilus]|uniref:SGNH/GDSL hydrolase family protein n=1 Tax=Arsenicicoccus dermatophilus TaxID=1076331 RepID=UPI0039170288